MLSRHEVDHVAALARLALTDAEAERMAVELSSILEHIDRIRALDLDGVAPTAHVSDATAPLRPDVPVPSLPREALLAAAPEVADGGFGVPSPGASAQ
ncbi:Asp-tRNA(Asn)/Glu-tRNA(Gln) amidotransferase subunit GatC [Conexibacter sp. DBS9H8]|uniref:Asp-tRNA(Asn)/Glu-tRNA(Gln) amidotransferase subunit GatC n=1 Tax=Conexibacter sp. DBS9H8 TaxID=2937801 RepID=UPI00200FA0F0|nr:Asp-tRNA(Asn)/Glu-tRNA(Gln) amidotransferase subunit GatC [Conexibacter sp. DBS9H8]